MSRARKTRKEALGAPLVVGVAEKMVDWGEGILAWFGTGGYDYRSQIRSEGAESARPYAGPDLLTCVATIPTVYRCAMRKATDKSRVPLKIGRVSKSGEFKPMDPYVDGSPAALFRSVNDNEGPASFRARLDCHLQLTGDGMVELEYLKSSRPREMWLMQSNSTTIIKGAHRKPLRYETSVPGQVEKRILTPEQVFHTRLPNPADDWRGLTWLRSTQIFAWLEDQIAKFNTEYLAHGGVPPGWISFDEFVQPEDRPDIMKEIREVSQGRGNRKRIGVVWDGAKWIPSGISPAEGEFIELLQTSKEQICSAAGVPVMYAGDMREASYANAFEQKEMYWFNTIIPELEWFAQDLTEMIHRIWGDDTIEARFDYEMIEAIQDLRLKRGTSLSELYKSGLLTRDEVRVEMGKPRSTGGDTFYQPQILVPAGMAIAAPPLKTNRPRLAKAWVDDPKRHAKRLEREMDMEGYVRAVLPMFEALADRRKDRILTSLKSTLTRTKSDDDVFDLEVAEDDYEAVLLQAYARIVSGRGQSAMGEVVEDPDFLSSVPGVTEWMERQAGAESKLIAEAEKRQLAETFAQANTDGLTSSELATKIAELYSVRRDEALRIAWTETGTAYNAATQMGWEQSGVVTQKAWLSSKDAFVRTLEAGDEFDHAAMDDIAVGMDEDFVVPGKNGDESIPYPGEGSAGNRINCRCTMVPVVDEDAKRARAAKKAAPVLVMAGDFDALFAEPTAA